MSSGKCSIYLHLDSTVDIKHFSRHLKVESSEAGFENKRKTLRSHTDISDTPERENQYSYRSVT